MLKILFRSALISTVLYSTILIIFLSDYIINSGDFFTFYQVVIGYLGWWVFFFFVSFSMLVIQKSIQKKVDTKNTTETNINSKKSFSSSVFYLFGLLFAGSYCVLSLFEFPLTFHPVFANSFYPIIFYFAVFIPVEYFGFRAKVNSWIFAIFSILSVLSIVAFVLLSFMNNRQYVGECNANYIYTDKALLQNSISIYKTINNKTLNGKLQHIGWYYNDYRDMFEILPVVKTNADGSQEMYPSEQKIPPDIENCPTVIKNIKKIGSN